MNEHDVQKLFGQKIRNIRMRKGLSQEELSVLIGKTSDTISNIERGFTSTKIKTAVELANALEIPLIELFDFDDLLLTGRRQRELLQEVVTVLKSYDEAELKGALDMLETYAATVARLRDQK